MKIGIITDIHSNVIALQKILQKFKDEKCDGVICCALSFAFRHNHIMPRIKII